MQRYSFSSTIQAVEATKDNQGQQRQKITFKVFTDALPTSRVCAHDWRADHPLAPLGGLAGVIAERVEIASSEIEAAPFTSTPLRDIQILLGQAFHAPLKERSLIGINVLLVARLSQATTRIDRN